MTEIFNFDANGELVEKFEHVLRQHNHELSAAEFHGTLTGLACAGYGWHAPVTAGMRQLRLACITADCPRGEVAACFGNAEGQWIR